MARGSISAGADLSIPRDLVAQDFKLMNRAALFPVDGCVDGVIQRFHDLDDVSLVDGPCVVQPRDDGPERHFGCVVHSGEIA